MENIEIGILKIKDACIDARTPIVQWVLPRINPPKYNSLIYSEDIRIICFVKIMKEMYFKYYLKYNKICGTMIITGRVRDLILFKFNI